MPYRTAAAVPAACNRPGVPELSNASTSPVITPAPAGVYVRTTVHVPLAAITWLAAQVPVPAFVNAVPDGSVDTVMGVVLFSVVAVPNVSVTVTLAVVAGEATPGVWANVAGVLTIVLATDVAAG